MAKVADLATNICQRAVFVTEVEELNPVPGEG